MPFRRNVAMSAEVRFLPSGAGGANQLLSLFGQTLNSSTALDHDNRAAEAIGAGRWNDAVEALRAAINADANDADAHFQLGDAYRELNRNAEAAEEYQHAIRLKPGDGQAYFQLGQMNNEQGKFAEAIEALKQAIRFLPNDAQMHAELGHAAVVQEKNRFPQTARTGVNSSHFPASGKASRRCGRSGGSSKSAR